MSHAILVVISRRALVRDAILAHCSYVRLAGICSSS